MKPFKYTYESFKLVLRDIKIFIMMAKYMTVLFHLIYFAIAFLFALGNFIANIIFASGFVIYTIISVIFDIKKIRNRKAKKIKNRAYRYFKIIVRGVFIVISFYELFCAFSASMTLAIITTVLSFIAWTITVILEIIRLVIENRIALIKESIEKDAENLSKPVRKPRNLIRRIFHKEEIQEKPESLRFKKFRKKIEEEELEEKNKKAIDQEIVEIENKSKKKQKKRKNKA